MYDRQENFWILAVLTPNECRELVENSGLGHMLAWGVVQSPTKLELIWSTLQQCSPCFNVKLGTDCR